MRRNQHVANKLPQLTKYVIFFITLNVQAKNKHKMGTSLCGIAMMLKRQVKIVDSFFLK